MARLPRLALVFPLLALGAGAAIVHGCTIMNGLTLPEREAGVADAAEASVDPCDHALPPADEPSSVEDGNLAFVTAINALDLGQNGFDGGAADAPAFAGFDLDRTCTCPAPPSCLSPAGTVCDDSRGRDNNFAPLIRGIASKGLDVQKKMTDGLQDGSSGLLLLVEQYNGKPDDARVFVTLAPSRGIREEYPDGGLSPKTNPTFTRADKWLIGSNQFVQVANNVVQSTKRAVGYVKNGQLRLSMESGEVSLGEGSLKIRLTDSYLVANVVPDGEGSFILREGELSGRWGVKDALLAAREVELTPQIGKLCKNPDLMPSVRTEICNAVDIASRRTDDGKQLPCDAVSLSLRFEGAKGSLGKIYVEPMLYDCPDASAEDTVCPR